MAFDPDDNEIETSNNQTVPAASQRDTFNNNDVINNSETNSNNEDRTIEDVDDSYFEQNKTPDEISSQVGAEKKKLIFIALGIAAVLWVGSLYFKAIKEIDQDEIRKITEKAKLPQDLNMTDDVVMWHTAKDAEIASLQDELNLLRTNANLNKSESNQTKNNTTEPTDNIAGSKASNNTLTKAEIEDIVRKSLSSIQKNPNAKNNLPPVTISFPNKKGVPTQQAITPDDFLTVPPSGQNVAPASINAATTNGVETLPPKQPTNNTVKKSVDIPDVANQQAAAFTSSGIKISSAPELGTKNSGSGSKEVANKKTYQLLTGLAKATLHTGFRAPTLAVGEGQTQPVFMSVDSQVIVANNDNIDIEECTVLGTAKGNINSSRAEIRLSDLTCVVKYKNGKKGRITEKINAWVYGEDGMFGIKGRLVSSEGKILESTLPIALLQALIGSLAQLGQSSVQTTSVGGIGGVGGVGTSSISSEELAKNGALSGFAKSTSSSLTQIVDYYISILKEMNPAIEILGGRNRLSILFKGGEDVSVKEYEPINLNEISKGLKR